MEQTLRRSNDSNLIEHFHEEIDVSGHRLKETKHPSTPSTKVHQVLGILNITVAKTFLDRGQTTCFTVIKWYDPIPFIFNMNRYYHNLVCDYIELVATAVINRCDR